MFCADDITARARKTVVLGMGNTLVSDDGVGIHTARLLERRLKDAPDVEVSYTSTAGLDLIALLEGYKQAIVIDAIKTEGGEPGQIYVMGLDQFASTLHFTSPHSVNLYTAVELGRRCGLSMPLCFRIVAIEIEDDLNVGEECTPRVAAAMPAAADIVVNILNPVCNKEI